MRGSKPIAAGATPTTIISADANWSKGIIINNSDSTIFVQWTKEPDTLTAANGFPIEPGQSLSVDAVGLPKLAPLTRRAAVQAVHSGAGDKEVRYVFE